MGLARVLLGYSVRKKMMDKFSIAAKENLSIISYYSYCMQETFLKDRRCFLRVALFIYSAVSAVLVSAFFITRRIQNTQLLSFVSFYTWEFISGLCLGAEIIRSAELQVGKC